MADFVLYIFKYHPIETIFYGKVCSFLKNFSFSFAGIIFLCRN